MRVHIQECVRLYLRKGKLRRACARSNFLIALDVLRTRWDGINRIKLFSSTGDD